MCEGLGHDQRVPDIGLSPSGGLQEPNPTTSSSFGDPGSSKFKVRVKMFWAKALSDWG